MNTSSSTTTNLLGKRKERDDIVTTTFTFPFELLPIDPRPHDAVEKKFYKDNYECVVGARIAQMEEDIEDGHQKNHCCKDGVNECCIEFDDFDNSCVIQACYESWLEQVMEVFQYYIPCGTIFTYQGQDFIFNPQRHTEFQVGDTLISIRVAYHDDCTFFQDENIEWWWCKGEEKERPGCGLPFEFLEQVRASATTYQEQVRKQIIHLLGGKDREAAGVFDLVPNLGHMICNYV
jgi:hypothetical protein